MLPYCAEAFRKPLCTFYRFPIVCARSSIRVRVIVTHPANCSDTLSNRTDPIHHHPMRGLMDIRSLRIIAALIGACGCFAIAVSGNAQSGAKVPEKPVLTSFLAGPDGATSDSTKKDAGAKDVNAKDSSAKDATVISSSDAAPATAAPSDVHPIPIGNDAIVKELVEMKARIAQLEAELKGGRSADDAAAADKDASALRAGEASTLGSGSSSSASPAVQEPAAAAAPEISSQITTKGEPFPGDWTWLNSNGHASDSPMSTKYFTPEFRADANYSLDYNHPKDDSLGGSTETFRADEWQLEQISVGGDIHINNVRGRILTMDGLFATTTPRNDATPSRGQWDLSNAYKYVSEAWGGYHWDVAHGVNLDAGIFVSYIGLFSYYNFDNWTYQPSFVSSNTPWFFNGLRLQYFPTKKLKIEPWI